MENTLFSYLKKLAIFTAILAVMYVVYVLLFPGFASGKAIASFLMLFVVTGFGHYLLLKSPRDKHKLVMNTLLIVVGKLLIYIGFAVALIVSDRSNAVGNITLFFALYLCFTVFDIFQQRQTRRESE